MWTNLLLGVAAGAGNILGGWLALPPWQGRVAETATRQEARLRFLLPIGAGFLLAVTLLEMIPAALSSVKPAAYAPLFVLGGYVLIHVVGQYAPHTHDSDHALDTPPHALSSRTLYAAQVGLAIHAFFDGVAIGSGGALSPALGTLLLVAIILHKVPEGATVASIAVLSGASRARALLLPALLGAATVAGAVAVNWFRATVAGEALAVAAGVTLYIAATDLVPHASHRRAQSPLLYAGIALFVLTDLALRWLGVG